jgi:steroid delta-isomerase-like uncharacterized protein
MSVERNKVVLESIREAINTGNFDTFDDLVVEDFQEHLNAVGAASGREGYRQMMRGVRAAFPDLTITHHNVIGQDDMLAFRMTASGTHKGEFAGLPPTGNRISFGGMEIMRFEDGRAAERWGELDQLGLLQQLGAIPTPDQP